MRRLDVVGRPDPSGATRSRTSPSPPGEVDGSNGGCARYRDRDRPQNGDSLDGIQDRGLILSSGRIILKLGNESSSPNDPEQREEIGMSTKYIFVTGGVVSSLGKGIAAASIGALLEARGFTVTLPKFDPYINVDPGTMSPFQHGEVYVTDDGAETDLDLGPLRALHLDDRLPRVNNIDDRPDLRARHRQGAARRLPRQDRPGDSAHHRRDQGQRSARGVAGRRRRDRRDRRHRRRHREPALPRGDPPVAARGRPRATPCYIHLTLVPYIEAAGELKTKPTQHSVKELRAIGIQPDILLCRTDRAAAARHQAQDRALLQRAGRGRHHGQGRADRSTKCRSCSAEKASTRRSSRPAEPRPLRARPLEVGDARRPDQAPHGRGRHRRRRQIRRLRRLVQVPQRGARPRRASPTTCG